MQILNDLKNPLFWTKVLQISLIFFVIFTGLSLLLWHFGEIVSGDFSAIYQEEWANGKWVDYFLVKFLISLVYGMYMTSRMLNRRRKIQ